MNNFRKMVLIDHDEFMSKNNSDIRDQKIYQIESRIPNAKLASNNNLIDSITTKQLHIENQMKKLLKNKKISDQDKIELINILLNKLSNLNEIKKIEIESADNKIVEQISDAVIEKSQIKNKKLVNDVNIEQPSTSKAFSTNNFNPANKFNPANLPNFNAQNSAPSLFVFGDKNNLNVQENEENEENNETLSDYENAQDVTMSEEDLHKNLLKFKEFKPIDPNLSIKPMPEPKTPIQRPNKRSVITPFPSAENKKKRFKNASKSAAIVKKWQLRPLLSRQIGLMKKEMKSGAIN